ncbi:MAG: PAS domain-containing protein, partial [Actinomycetes bacterium]
MPWDDPAHPHAAADVVVEQLGPIAVASAVRDLDGVIRDFRYDYVNEAFARAVGHTAVSLVGHPMLDVHPDLTDNGWFTICRSVVADQAPTTTQAAGLGVLPSGATYDVTLRPFADGFLLEGRPTATARRGDDGVAPVTEHPEPARCSIVDALPEAVYMMSAVRDDDGRVVDFCFEHVNDAFCELVGVDRDTLLTHSLLELFATNHSVGMFDAYREVLTVQQPFAVEVPWHDERRGRCLIQLTIAPFETGLVGTGRDVTLQRQLEEQQRADALSDPLTGLSNRRMLIDRIRHDLD